VNGITVCNRPVHRKAQPQKIHDTKLKSEVHRIKDGEKEERKIIYEEGIPSVLSLESASSAVLFLQLHEEGIDRGFAEMWNTTTCCWTFKLGSSSGCVGC
jgi:hypothetical protein